MPDLHGSVILGQRTDLIPLTATAPKLQPAPMGETGHARSGSLWTDWVEEEPIPELRWPDALNVYQRMRKDPQVQSLLRAVMLPILRTSWRLAPNGARDEVVAQTAEDLGLPIAGDGGGDKPRPRARDRFSWSQHLEWALLMVVFGAMPFEQDYRLDDRGRTRLRKLGPRWPRTIVDWVQADDGGLVSIKQRPLKSGGDPVEIKVGRLVVYSHQREGDWRGQSLLRSSYIPWMLKNRLLPVQNYTIERNGMGVPVITAEEDASPAQMAKYLALVQAYRSGVNAGMVLPHDADLTLKGVTGELPDADTAIRYYDEQIARSFLGHFLNLGSETGSWALGSTFADFFILSEEALAGQVEDVANQHVVEDLVDDAWGPDEAAPLLVHDEIGSQQAATAQALKLLVDAGILDPDRPLEEAVRQLMGLPAKASPPPTPTNRGSS